MASKLAPNVEDTLSFWKPDLPAIEMCLESFNCALLMNVMSDTANRQRMDDDTRLPEDEGGLLTSDFTFDEVSGLSAQFRILYAALCELAPDYRLYPGTTLGTLIQAVIQARPDWFEGIAAKADFWTVLKKRDVPRRHYFTIADLSAFEHLTPDKATSGFTLRELLEWLSATCEAADIYPIHTGQEMDLLGRSASDGRPGRVWCTIEQRGARVYEIKGTSHRIELVLTSEDQAAGLTLSALEKLTAAQDADCVFAILYVCGVLAPPAPLPANQAAIGWINLDDVMEKIGWYPSKRDKRERDELRMRLWRYLVFGDRATIVGVRSGTYTDRTTGEVIDTQVESPIWRIMSVERPFQESLFDDGQAAPLRAQIAVSKQLEPLLTAPFLAQYLPFGELLGAIAPQKVGGDWARNVGLTLAGFWRRNPNETDVGTLKPTRRELLTRFTPKTRTVEDILSGTQPKRAVKYWHEALQLLIEQGVLEAEGEAARTVEDMLKPYKGRYGWQEAWLSESVDLKPGPRVRESVHDRAVALPVAKVRTSSPRRRSRTR